MSSDKKKSVTDLTSSNHFHLHMSHVAIKPFVGANINNNNKKIAHYMCIYIHICFIFFFISCSIFIEDRHKTTIMGRSEFKELTEQEFAQIVKNQAVYNLRGGGLNDINIFRTQKRYLRGSGLLSTFANLGKLLLPAIRRFVLPAVGSFTSGIVKDVSAGKNFKESVKRRGKKNL